MASTSSFQKEGEAILRRRQGLWVDLLPLWQGLVAVADEEAKEDAQPLWTQDPGFEVNPCSRTALLVLPKYLVADWFACFSTCASRQPFESIPREVVTDILCGLLRLPPRQNWSFLGTHTADWMRHAGTRALTFNKLEDITALMDALARDPTKICWEPCRVYDLGSLAGDGQFTIAADDKEFYDHIRHRSENSISPICFPAEASKFFIEHPESASRALLRSASRPEKVFIQEECVANANLPDPHKNLSICPDGDAKHEETMKCLVAAFLREQGPTPKKKGRKSSVGGSKDATFPCQVVTAAALAALPVAAPLPPPPPVADDA